MRLTKKAYHVTYEREIIDYDDLGRPIYDTIEIKTPFKCEVEPYSSGLANHTYGVTVDVSYRLFTYPHDFLNLGEPIKYNDEDHTITEVMKYDRHFEVLVKRDV